MVNVHHNWCQVTSDRLTVEQKLMITRAYRIFYQVGSLSADAVCCLQSCFWRDSISEKMKITALAVVCLLSAAWANSHYMPRDRDRDQQRMGDDDDNESRGEDSNESEEGSREDPPPPPPQRVYTFAVERQNRPFSYLDMNLGRVVGLGMDIMRQACEIANQRCDYIYIKTFAPCWDGERGISEGLMNNWFDGCTATYRTFERDLVHGFSRPIAQQRPNDIYARSNDEINPEELRREGNSVAVGFVEGWFTDRFCLQQNDFHINMANMRSYDDPDSLKDALRRGEVRVAFGGSITDAETEFRVFQDNIFCAISGSSVMVRKGNTQLLDWLNPALDRVIASHEYASGCYTWEKVFDRQARCFQNMDNDDNGRPAPRD